MEQASLKLNGSPADVLLDPLAFPLWNEAFLSIDGPRRQSPASATSCASSPA